jgi:hypothetical protein
MLPHHEWRGDTRPPNGLKFETVKTAQQLHAACCKNHAAEHCCMLLHHNHVASINQSAELSLHAAEHCCMLLHHNHVASINQSAELSAMHASCCMHAARALLFFFFLAVSKRIGPAACMPASKSRGALQEGAHPSQIPGLPAPAGSDGAAYLFQVAAVP